MSSTPYQTAVSVGVPPTIIPVTVPVFACSAIANADELTTYTPGFNFEVVKIDWVTVTPVTTAAKTATINPKIGSTVIPGTATPLAGTQAKGATVPIWTPTGHTYGKTTDTISLTASAVTAFVEGAGYFIIQIRNIGNES
jgi:hypothetical protein